MYNLRLKHSDGFALPIAVFIALVCFALVTMMVQLSKDNSYQIVHNKQDIIAKFAAESGLSGTISYLQRNYDSEWGQSLQATDLPDVGHPIVLGNGATYYVNDIDYEVDFKSALVKVIGHYQGSVRQIRAKLMVGLPSIFDTYGLLSDAVIDINGNKTLETSIHGNGGVSLSGINNMLYGSRATQSADDTAGAPSISNNIGGYIPPVDVPLVKITELSMIAAGGVVVDPNHLGSYSSVYDAVRAQDPSYPIFISACSRRSGPSTACSHGSVNLSLGGDMEGRLIFIDGDANLTLRSGSTSHMHLVVNGDIIMDGSSGDIDSSPEGYLNTIISSDGDITLNGSRTFNALFWTNGGFRQNGSSMAGRVVAQDNIVFDGEFTLSVPDKAGTFENLDIAVKKSNWELIPVDEEV